MDPNEALRRLREIANNVMVIDDRESPEGLDDGAAAGLQDFAVEMAGHFEALDRWIQNGGFLPNTWAEVETAPIAWVVCKEEIEPDLNNFSSAIATASRFTGEGSDHARKLADAVESHVYRVVKA